jgi:hypothetical protein
MLLDFWSSRHWALRIRSWRLDSQDFYLAVLRVCGMRYEESNSEIWTEGRWFLHHDNATAHTALSVGQFLAKHSTLTLPQPPCFPDFSSPNLSLFPKLKMTLTEEDFRHWTPSSLMWQMTWRRCNRHPSNSASRSGKGGEGVHCCTRGLFWRG